ncbi:protein Skeletor, isoforms B/C isoform X2 [Harmonia axyridis]|uniref:protein Skeletor, isoforms B/C isoform X2 n=1 Tax=Harmonia axyridis TaxID=115357 RepID=UPI001E279BF0|nr:protein Skeletor, isoforms B/C isoform X2 [Harmonia axyridis]
MAALRPVLAFVLVGLLSGEVRAGQYFGKLIGKLSELHHGVSGEVYAVDSRTLYIKDFTYDGQGPAAYFYAGNSRTPGSSGFRLRDENGSGEVIRRYRKEGVTLSMPEGKNLNNIKIFYVWCEEFAVNFGDVKIPRNLDYPRPVKIDPLQGVHGVSSDNVVVVDAQTLLIPNFSYDGEAPDAKFWVGRGSKPSPQGIRIPDENGKEKPLRRYDRKTIVLNLPGDLTVFEIGHFGIWCEAFTVDFGHILIPQNLNVPPSLKMLGVSPQSKLNCEVLQDSTAFEVRWAMAGDSVIIQLVAKLDEREYMSFGVSGEETGSVMINGDIAVAYIDKETGKGHADDYFLKDKSQCSGQTGSCPDSIFRENTGSIKMLNAAKVNGYSIVTYQRPLMADDEFDQPIYANESTAIIWAIGPLNDRNQVSFHSEYLKKDKFFHFGRYPKWNCPAPEVEQPMKTKTTQDEDEEEAVVAPTSSRNKERRRGSNRNRGNTVAESEGSESERVASRLEHSGRRGSNKNSVETSRRNIPTPAPASKKDAWTIPPIQCYEPDDGVFYAQMGPTGGKRGYPAITGHVGWGISWYINGLLIPEINVVRGKTYTFVIEGGLDQNVPAKYHPFYITDDPVGGYEHQSAQDKKGIRIFAGAQRDKDGNVYPTGTGRLCHWTQKGDLEADDFASFGAYQRTLELKCDQGEPGVIQWTPDDNTPDTVYYQCFTHRYLGWKINVLDSCDEQPAASETRIVSVPFPIDQDEDVKAETMVTPNSFSNEDVEDKVAYEISAVGEDIVAYPDKQSKMIRNDLPYLNPQNFYFNRNLFQPNNFPTHQSYYNGQQYQPNPQLMSYAPFQPNYQTFRPSPLIYTGLEEISSPADASQASTAPPLVTSTTTTTTSTTTTTPLPITSTTTSSTTTTSEHSLLEAASNNTPNKTIVISFTKNQQRHPVRSYIKVPLTTSSKKKPVRHLTMPQSSKIIIHSSTLHLWTIPSLCRALDLTPLKKVMLLRFSILKNQAETWVSIQVPSKLKKASLLSLKGAIL